LEEPDVQASALLLYIVF